MRLTISDLLFVRRGICLFCREEETEGDAICPDCQSALDRRDGTVEIQPGFACTYAYFYTRSLMQVLWRFKFRGGLELLEPLAVLFADHIRARHDGEADCLLPVPMHRAAERRRGYNQAVLLAEEVGRRLDLPVVHPIRKIRDTKEQNRLHKAERAENLRGAFALHKESDVRGKRVLLLDDFVTTGATLREVYEALLPAQPKEVRACAFTSPRAEPAGPSLHFSF